MDIINIIVLALSSLLLTFVGSVRLFKPIETYAKNSGITLPSDASLLNEMRGVSAVMLSAGFIIALGISFQASPSPHFSWPSWCSLALPLVGS